MDQEKWNKYYIDGTDVFKNKLGITNKEELLQSEADISFEKNLELYESPIQGNFDKKHLCEIHKYIFDSIYPWAGEYRNVSMSKDDFTYFVDPSLIDTYLDNTLTEMNEAIKYIHDRPSYVSFITEYFNLLNIIHPFREGNGRTIREFLREFVLVYMPGYNLDWSKIDKDNMINAVKLGYVNNGLLEMEFYKALVPNLELEGEAR